MVRKEVEVKPIYQQCWISYLGAASGILKSLGKECDVVDIGGYSGWSFFVNVMKGALCPSGPTAHNAYLHMNSGVSDLGFDIESYYIPRSFPSKEGELSEEDDEKAKQLFDAVKTKIDKTNKPVILWGIPVPEYGIVYGYTEDSYLVSTFRNLHNQPDDPIRYDQIQAPGWMHFFSFNEEISILESQRDKDAIIRAFNFAIGQIKLAYSKYADEEGKPVPIKPLEKNSVYLTSENYVTGPNAFIEWADVLESVGDEPHSYHGNSYVAECALEGKITAVEFLIRLKQKYEGKRQSEYFNKAALAFTESLKILREFNSIFPFAFQGDMSQTKRKKGAKLLRKIHPHELEAIEHLRSALYNWT